MSSGGLTPKASLNTKSSFEALPSTVLINLLQSSSCIRDLLSLTSSSPACHKLFDRYPISIWTGFTQNAIGGDAWKVASTVMIYQRHKHLGLSAARVAISEDLKANFALQKSDIPRLIRNQRFFESCSKDFLSKLIELRVSPRPFFKTGYTLSPKLFYNVWLTGFYYEYKSFTSLARLKPLSPQEYADFAYVSIIMCNNRYSIEIGCTEDRETEAEFSNLKLSSFVLNTRFCAEIVLDPKLGGNYAVNPAFYHQIIYGLKTKYERHEFVIRIFEFFVDYSRETLKQIMEKYKPEKGAEDANSDLL